MEGEQQRMILSKENLKNIRVPGLVVPNESLFELPEKVLQFGTGVLLRGLPDFYIDKANRAGIFNGRIVVVKSTDSGAASDFEQQDSLYTLAIKGIADGEKYEQDIVCSAISRVLSAGKDWQAILEFARSPDLQMVTSNTTEVGIQLVEGDVHKSPPVSFPGKLLAVLMARYEALGGSEATGLVIVPAELVVDNGKKLRQIVLQLATDNQFDAEFINWLETCNYFCDSLVDRIVPGKPNAKTMERVEDQCGYRDDLRIESEVYSLWAIQGGEKVKSVLTFAEADKGVIITRDIEKYRELKLRLLNGTHTLSCAVAILSGFKTVREAMDDAIFSAFIIQLIYNEIAPAIPYKVDIEEAQEFAGKVLDRFRNPHIDHMWMSISAQYSLKMKARVVPLLLQHYRLQSTVPDHIALGFAAFIRFMKSVKNERGEFIGIANGNEYKITDDNAAYFAKAWKEENLETLVSNILSDENLWGGPNLTILPDFEDAVYHKLTHVLNDGVFDTVE